MPTATDGDQLQRLVVTTAPCSARWWPRPECAWTGTFDGVRPRSEASPERMRHAGIDGVPVTRSDGTLAGMFERRHAEHATTAQGG